MTAIWSKKRTKGKDGKEKYTKKKKAGSVQRRAIPQVPYTATNTEHFHGETGVEGSQVLEPIQAVEQAPPVVDVAVESSSTVEPKHAVKPSQAIGQAAFVAPETIAEQGPGAVKVEAAPPDRSPTAPLTISQLPAARPPSLPPIAAILVVPGACPQPAIALLPASLATIPLESLGRPGLVSDIASKHKRCPVVVKYPLVLPEAPVGNTVVSKCVAPPGCPETWQPYTCLSAGGWSAPSPCYGKKTNNHDMT